MSPYRFLPGRTGYGIGAENMAFQQPTTLPVDSIYAPRYNVRASMSSQHPGYIKTKQDFVPVDLKADGVYLSGTLALQALAQFEGR